ncbi:MAG: DUF4194 domain-containing protein [Treponema sp.]|jgi:hypothetical protein|nr:DUF4194 domain-containing protein [Treponema sp.]
MTIETAYLSRITELPDDEFELFRASLRMLLAKTFIIRGREQEEALYDFAIRNMPIYDAWFSCMDAGVIRDESLGVIAFRGGSGVRLRLNREETCALLVFRLLYEEKRTELSLTSFPSITVLDFTQRYDAMTQGSLKKTRLEEILRRLQAHKLIEVLSSDLSDAEALIVLYPSLALSVSRDSIDELLRILPGKKAGSAGATGDIEPPLPEEEE